MFTLRQNESYMLCIKLKILQKYTLNKWLHIEDCMKVIRMSAIGLNIVDRTKWLL